MKKQLGALLAITAFTSSINAMQQPQRANVDALSQNVTSLWRAVYNNGKDVTAENINQVRDLIRQGANPNIELSSSTPVEIALVRLTQRGLDPAEAQRRLQVLRVLLSNGAELRSRRYNIVTLINNMQESAVKQDLLELLRSRGLL